MRIEFAWRDRDRRLSIRLANGSRMLPPAPRRMLARLAGSQKSTAVRFEGKPLEVRL